jgi:hypothetical protein
MRRLFAVFAFACLSIPLFAQNLATVSANNIADVGGNKLASGQLCFLATDQNDNPISFQVGGGGQVIRRTFCSTVTAGAAGTFTVPNPATTSPSGIFYRVTVKDSSTGQEVLRYAGVTFSGTTFAFDSYVPLLAGAVFAPLTGTSVAGNLAVSGNLNVTGSFSAGSMSANSASIGASGLGLTSGTATAASNASSAPLVWNGSWWNGTSAVPENWACIEGPASTIPNPQRSFFSCVHSAGIPLGRVQFQDANPATVGANFASPDLDLTGHYWNGTASVSDEVLLSTTYGTGANPNVTATLNHVGTSGIFSLDLSVPKTVKIRRVLGGGTALVVGDIALSPGWGNTATISGLGGTDAAFRFAVTPNGTGIAANPTITVTFHDGTWTTIPICQITSFNPSGPAPQWYISGSTTASILIVGTNAQSSFTPTAGVGVGLMVSCQQSPN